MDRPHYWKENLSADTQYSSSAFQRSTYLNKRMTLLVLFLGLNVTLTLGVVASLRFMPAATGWFGVFVISAFGSLTCYYWSILNRDINFWIRFYTNKLVQLESSPQRAIAIRVFSDPQSIQRLTKDLEFEATLRNLIKNLVRIWQILPVGAIIMAIPSVLRAIGIAPTP